MFIGAVLVGTFLGYVAAGVMLAIGLSFWAAALALIGTGVTVTLLLLMRLFLCYPVGDDGPTPPRARFGRIGASALRARPAIQGAATVAGMAQSPRLAAACSLPCDAPRH